ncbi:MAG: hypothetical protein F4Y80_02900, partial [Caldilineaceae bacterium SB0665_bin_21]|nr:hypothetical protein [Caldilineaceae bacterium SB0665_bin_21]
MRRKHIGFYLASVALSIGVLLAGLYLDGFFVDTGPEDSLLAASERPGGEIQAEQGFNGNGSQPLSNQAEPDEPSPLPPPHNVQVAHRAPGLVKLEWDRAALPQSYQVIYWHVGHSNSEWIVLPNAGIQVEMDVEARYGAWISELPEHPDKVHHFAVRTITDGNHSAWTETISTSSHFNPSPESERQLQTSVLSVVNQETNFEPNILERVTTRLVLPQKLTGRYQTRESIVLDWEDVPGAHSYRVRVWDEARVGWSVLPTERFPISWDGSRVTIHFELDSFDSVMKSQLMFSVQAVGKGGHSSWTKPVGVPLVLDTPTGLFGQLHEGNGIGLDWQDVPLADFYEVRYRSSAFPDSQWIMLSGATGIRVTMDGSSAYIDSLPGGDDFVFQVRAITGNYEVCSDWSEDMEITQSGEPGTTPGTEPGTT